RRAFVPDLRSTARRRHGPDWRQNRFALRASGNRPKLDFRGFAGETINVGGPIVVAASGRPRRVKESITYEGAGVWATAGGHRHTHAHRLVWRRACRSSRSPSEVIVYAHAGDMIVDRVRAARRECGDGKLGHGCRRHE